MYKLILFIVFALSSIACAETREDRWLRTLDAVWAQESSRRLAPPDGDNGKAVGPLQMWKQRVDDCNRIVGYKRWTYEDRRDWMKSSDMFWTSCMHYWPNGTEEQWARHWNGNPRTGPSDESTRQYWQGVQSHMRKR